MVKKTCRPDLSALRLWAGGASWRCRVMQALRTICPRLFNSAIWSIAWGGKGDRLIPVVSAYNGGGRGAAQQVELGAEQKRREYDRVSGRTLPSDPPGYHLRRLKASLPITRRRPGSGPISDNHPGGRISVSIGGACGRLHPGAICSCSRSGSPRQRAAASTSAGGCGCALAQRT